MHNIGVLRIQSYNTNCSRTSVRKSLDNKTSVRYNTNIVTNIRSGGIEMNRLFNFISNKKVTIIVAIIIEDVFYVSIKHMDASEDDDNND